MSSLSVIKDWLSLQLTHDNVKDSENEYLDINIQIRTCINDENYGIDVYLETIFSISPSERVL